PAYREKADESGGGLAVAVADKPTSTSSPTSDATSRRARCPSGRPSWHPQLSRSCRRITTPWSRVEPAAPSILPHRMNVNAPAARVSVTKLQPLRVRAPTRVSAALAAEAAEPEHRVQLDRVRGDAGLAVVVVEECDPGDRGAGAEPNGVPCRLHLH